jgi:hypothetical protein
MWQLFDPIANKELLTMRLMRKRQLVRQLCWLWHLFCSLSKRCLKLENGPNEKGRINLQKSLWAMMLFDGFIKSEIEKVLLFATGQIMYQ